MGDEQYQPDMPPVDCGEHLVDYLWKWGPTMYSSMGDSPLTHQEISYCQGNSGVELTEWESSTVVRLSKEYFAETHRATKRDCQPPFGEDPAIKLSYEREQARRLAMFFG